jgi:hypothetical protein
MSDSVVVQSKSPSIRSSVGRLALLSRLTWWELQSEYLACLVRHEVDGDEGRRMTGLEAEAATGSRLATSRWLTQFSGMTDQLRSRYALSAQRSSPYCDFVLPYRSPDGEAEDETVFPFSVSFVIRRSRYQLGHRE